MGIRDLVPFLDKKKQLAIDPYGGGIRPPVVGPSRLRKQLGILLAIRTGLTAALFTAVAANAIAIYILVGKMDTQLYVADGTPFGCPVNVHKVAEK